MLSLFINFWLDFDDVSSTFNFFSVVIIFLWGFGNGRRTFQGSCPFICTFCFSYCFMRPLKRERVIYFLGIFSTILFYFFHYKIYFWYIVGESPIFRYILFLICLKKRSKFYILIKFLTIFFLSNIIHTFTFLYIFLHTHRYLFKPSLD